MARWAAAFIRATAKSVLWKAKYDNLPIKKRNTSSARLTSTQFQCLSIAVALDFDAILSHVRANRTYTHASMVRSLIYEYMVCIYLYTATHRKVTRVCLFLFSHDAIIQRKCGQMRDLSAATACAQNTLPTCSSVRDFFFSVADAQASRRWRTSLCLCRPDIDRSPICLWVKRKPTMRQHISESPKSRFDFIRVHYLFRSHFRNTFCKQMKFWFVLLALRLRVIFPLANRQGMYAKL